MPHHARQVEYGGRSTQLLSVDGGKDFAAGCAGTKRVPLWCGSDACNSVSASTAGDLAACSGTISNADTPLLLLLLELP